MRISSTTVTVLFLASAAVLAACGSSPTAPSPAAATIDTASANGPAGALMRFTDRETGLATTDVRDAHDQVVQFNTAGELVWTMTGARFPGFLADGGVVTADHVCAGCYFLVRFSSMAGERRAYLTWSGDPAPDRPVTILNVNVVAGRLVVEDTDVTLPAR
jgi:hypothetical protein